MNLDRAVIALAGTIVVLGAALAALVSGWWLLLTAFVGLNLLQSSVTGFCPAAVLLARLGMRTGCAFQPRPPLDARRPDRAPSST